MDEVFKGILMVAGGIMLVGFVGFIAWVALIVYITKKAANELPKAVADMAVGMADAMDEAMDKFEKRPFGMPDLSDFGVLSRRSCDCQNPGDTVGFHCSRCGGRAQ
jgi:hypothetical protein